MSREHVPTPPAQRARQCVKLAERNGFVVSSATPTGVVLSREGSRLEVSPAGCWQLYRRGTPGRGPGWTDNFGLWFKAGWTTDELRDTLAG